jgi:hypothetical protein
MASDRPEAATPSTAAPALREALKQMIEVSTELALAGGTHGERGKPDRKRWFHASKAWHTAKIEAEKALATTPQPEPAGLDVPNVLILSWAIDEHAQAMRDEPVHDEGTCSDDCAGDICARYARLQRSSGEDG